MMVEGKLDTGWTDQEETHRGICQAKGLDYTSGANYAFLLRELQTTHSSSVASVKATSSLSSNTGFPKYLYTPCRATALTIESLGTDSFTFKSAFKRPAADPQ